MAMPNLVENNQILTDVTEGQTSYVDTKETNTLDAEEQEVEAMSEMSLNSSEEFIDAEQLEEAQKSGPIPGLSQKKMVIPVKSGKPNAKAPAKGKDVSKKLNLKKTTKPGAKPATAVKAAQKSSIKLKAVASKSTSPSKKP